MIVPSASGCSHLWVPFLPQKNDKKGYIPWIVSVLKPFFVMQTIRLVWIMCSTLRDICSVNPWKHPHILRPAGVRNLDLSAPKSSKRGPPQQSLPDVLRNLLRNQSEPLETSTHTTGVRNLNLSAPKSSKSGPPQQSLPDVLRNLLRNQSEPLDSTHTTTRGGPEFGPFSPEKLKKRIPASRHTTSPQNTNISQRLDRSWMSVCCAECSSLSATAVRLAAESPRPRTHQWPRETMACAAAPADPLEQPSARRLHLRKSHLPEEWHPRKGLNSNLILLIHTQ